MNERIKQLIVQSGNGQFHNDKCYPHIGSRTLEDWKKFAELIISECIDIIGPYAVRMDDFDGGHPIADLKKHFGVE